MEPNQPTVGWQSKAARESGVPQFRRCHGPPPRPSESVASLTRGHTVAPLPQNILVGVAVFLTALTNVLPCAFNPLDTRRLEGGRWPSPLQGRTNRSGHHTLVLAEVGGRFSAVAKL